MEGAARALSGEDPEEVEQEAGHISKIPVVPQGAEWNAVERVMLERRSVRKYKKAQVPAHVIRRLLEVARFAPSQGNCQPWKFIVVRDPGMIRGMEEFCVGRCRKLSTSLDYAALPAGSLKYRIARAKAKLFGRLQPNAAHPVPVSVCTLIAQGRFAVFHRAPTVLLILMDKRGIGIPPVDIGICGTNIVLAAHSLGLGSCWIGFSKLLNDSHEWCERLGVEPPYEIAEAITVGYPVGDTTHMVPRATHETVWFEDGNKKTLY
ncbi:MAG: nitroreductase family protein [Burkholderiales bacterium]|nr:nitroreductase family protein [Burkholderiales bacterium]